MAAEHFDQDNSGAAAGSGAGGGGAGGGAHGGGVDDNVGLGGSHFCIAFVDYTQGYVFQDKLASNDLTEASKKNHTDTMKKHSH